MASPGLRLGRATPLRMYMEAIVAFLADNHLEAYAEIFEEKGYDDLAFLREMSDADFAELKQASLAQP